MVKVNLGGVAAMGIPVPDGTYPATITSAKDGKTKANDAKVTVEFTIKEGDKHAGSKVWRTFTFSDKAVGFYKGAMIMLGIDESELEGAIDTEEINEQLIGTDCFIRVANTKDESGRPGTNVTIVEEDSSWANS